MEEHNCVGAEKKLYDNLSAQTKGHYNRLVVQGYVHKKTKAYPAGYPMNEDAIGIELVGKQLGKADDSPFEEPTPAQQGSLQWLVRELLETLHLQRTDIYRHPQVSRKSEGEAAHAQP